MSPSIPPLLHLLKAKDVVFNYFIVLLEILFKREGLRIFTT